MPPRKQRTAEMKVEKPNNGDIDHATETAFCHTCDGWWDVYTFVTRHSDGVCDGPEPLQHATAEIENFRKQRSEAGGMNKEPIPSDSREAAHGGVIVGGRSGYRYCGYCNRDYTPATWAKYHATEAKCKLVAANGRLAKLERSRACKQHNFKTYIGKYHQIYCHFCGTSMNLPRRRDDDDDGDGEGGDDEPTASTGNNPSGTQGVVGDDDE